MNKYKTEQRKKLIAIFKNHPHQTFSAQEIFNLDNSISISAIYRNLAEMTLDGSLCKVKEAHRSVTLYQYIDPEHCVGIVHLKCQNCENTFHLNHAVSQMIINLANEDFSFNIDTRTAFLYGECDNCKNQKNITKEEQK